VVSQSATSRMIHSQDQATRQQIKDWVDNRIENKLTNYHAEIMKLWVINRIENKLTNYHVEIMKPWVINRIGIAVKKFLTNIVRCGGI